jgi:hypothetical protein
MTSPRNKVIMVAHDHHVGLLRFAECVSAVILLYTFRNFERQMGSSKFVSFVAIVSFFAATIQLGLLVSLPFIQRVSPGPYALIFALFVLYYGATVDLRGISLPLFSPPCRPRVHVTTSRACGCTPPPLFAAMLAL